ncbi:MAG: hypothetical protein Q9222_004851 [Ikaeria aurantiellina]
MPVSEILDMAGPMAKSAIDIADPLDIMAVRSPESQYPAEGLRSKATGSWDNLRLGTVKTSDWRLSEDLAEPDEDWYNQQEKDLDAAYDALRSHGVSVKGPIDFPKGDSLAHVKSDLIRMDFSSVKTTKQLVQFNDEHKELELPAESPNQDVLKDSLIAEPWTEEQNAKRLVEGQAYAGINGIDKVLAENDVNIILGPADSWLTDPPCVSGYPSAMLPLSFWKKNGRAFGVIALTSNHREDLLIQLMSAWETVFPVINPPTL